MANGHGHKIPQQYWQEMYQLYASGTPVSEIHKKLTQDYKVDVSERTVYNVVKIMRDEKRKQINELLNAEANDDVGRLNWLQNQLEEIAVECRFSDKAMFMKAADRLIRIHQLKIVVRSANVPMNVNVIDDNGRAKLLEELQKLS